MIIRVVKRDHPYVMIDKTALEDPRLSFRAKGLHAYLLTKPDNWTPNRKQLMTVSREGRDAVAHALKELEAAGYLVRRKGQDKKSGKFVWIATVYEVSQITIDGKPGDGFPGDGFPGNVISKEVKNRENKKTSASKPRFPNDWYKQNVDDYQKIKEVELSGDHEFGEIQRTLKTIYKAGHTPEDVRTLMKAFEKSKEEWTDNWTIHTVARKLPEFLAGKLFRTDGRDAPRIQALQDAIGEIDSFVEYKIDAVLARLSWQEQTEEVKGEVVELKRTRAEKLEERARLVGELKKQEVSGD